MSIFAKIQIALAIIFVVFECVIIQLCHTAANSLQNYSDISDIGVGGLFIYLAIVLVALGIKKLVELHEARELKNTILGFIYLICFIAVLVFIYQLVYQILIVLGVDQKTANEWPIIVFFGFIFILSVIICIIEIIEDLRKNNIIK